MAGLNSHRKPISDPLLRKTFQDLQRQAQKRELATEEIRLMLRALGVPISKLAAEWVCWEQDIHRVIRRTPGRSVPRVRETLALYLGVPVSAVGRDASKPKRAA